MHTYSEQAFLENIIWNGYLLGKIFRRKVTLVPERYSAEKLLFFLFRNLPVWKFFGQTSDDVCSENVLSAETHLVVKVVFDPNNFRV